MLQAIDGTIEVGLGHIRGVFSIAGLYTWFSGALNEPIDWTNLFEVGDFSNITMDKLNLSLTQPREA